ncbi:MAG TPA: hypothetical protein VG479_00055 [Gaiellaceae bacterium]|nr:hypothetical protein [Gaiellaceae bacterium]
MATRPDREALAAAVGGLTYGTVVVLSVIVAGAKTFPDAPGLVGLIVLVTTATFWLAHVYAHSLALSIGHDTHLSLARLGQTARREAAILGAGIPPGAALLLGALGVLDEKTAVWLALALGTAVLFAMGLVFARVERLGRLGTCLAVLANLALGTVLILLKVLVVH